MEDDHKSKVSYSEINGTEEDTDTDFNVGDDGDSDDPKNEPEEGETTEDYMNFAIMKDMYPDETEFSY